MRYIFLALFSGLLMGALAPIDLVIGASCETVTNTHDFADTVCDDEITDYTQDDFTNSGSSGLVCIKGEEVNNVLNFGYGNQCESLASGPVQYTVTASRENDAAISTWRTDVTFCCGTGCDDDFPHTDSQTQHVHGSAYFEECDG